MDKLLIPRNSGGFWQATMRDEGFEIMTKAEALEKFPNLEGMGQIDLIMTRKGAIEVEDDLFIAAIDAVLKP